MADGHAIKLRLDNERLMRVNLDLEARIATLEAQLAAARKVITADDEYFEIPRGFDVLLTTDGVDARQACRRARKAAAKLDNPPKEDSDA